MVFSWLIWSHPKNYLSVRMSKGNFGRHESLRWLFRHPKPLSALMCPVESSRTWNSTFIRKFKGIFCLYVYIKISRRSFFNNNRNIMVMKIVLKTQPPKIVGKLVEQLRISSELAQWRLVMLLWPLHFC